MNRPVGIPLTQHIQTRVWPKVSGYIPRRKTPRPVPWNYNKDDVLFRLSEDQIGEIALNRQESGNFLNAENIRAMNDRLWGWRLNRNVTMAIIHANDSFEEGVGLWKPKNPPTSDSASEMSNQIEAKYRVKALVPLTAAAPEQKIFCSGVSPVDIAENRTNFSVLKETFANAYACSHLLASFSKHSIVLLDGHASGTGASIFLQSQFVVASDSASIEWPEASYGLIPAGGASFLLSKMPRQPALGKYLGMTGKKLEGADVFHAGLSRYFVDSKHFSGLKDELMQQRQKFPLLDSLLREKTNASVIAPFSLQEYTQAIEEAFSANSLEEIYANLERLSTEHHSLKVRQWSEECREKLKSSSQTSLAIFLRLFSLPNASIVNSFQMEFKVVNNLLRHLELFDGISAKFVRNEPLENPTFDGVDSFFERPKLFVPLTFHALYDFTEYPLIAERLFKS